MTIGRPQGSHPTKKSQNHFPKCIYQKLEQELHLLLAVDIEINYDEEFLQELSDDTRTEISHLGDDVVMLHTKKVGFIRRQLLILYYIEKADKKVSPTPRDIISLTQRIETLTEIGEKLNLEFKILLDKTEKYREVFSLTQN